MKLFFKTVLFIILFVILLVEFNLAVYVGFKLFSFLLKFILSGDLSLFT